MDVIKTLDEYIVDETRDAQKYATMAEQIQSLELCESKKMLISTIFKSISREELAHKLLIESIKEVLSKED